MAFITPKTDWASIDGIGFDDLNRIEGNTKFLFDTTQVLKRFCHGYEISLNTGSSFVVEPGECMDDTNQFSLTLPFNFTKTSGSWVEGINNGSVAPGVILAIHTWYYVFVLSKADGQSDIQIDDNISGSNISATGFIFKRRIGTIKTTDTATIFHAMVSKNDKYYLNIANSSKDTEIDVSGAGATDWTLSNATTLRLTPDIETQVYGNLLNNSTLGRANVWPFDFGNAFIQGVGIPGGNQPHPTEILQDKLGRVKVRNPAIGTTGTVKFELVYFVDDRGRNQPFEN